MPRKTVQPSTITSSSELPTAFVQRPLPEVRAAGMGNVESERALTLPHSSPLLIDPNEDSIGSSCSPARWPGVAPLLLGLGRLAPPRLPRSRTLETLTGPLLPMPMGSFRLPGPAVSRPIEMLPESSWSGLRAASTRLESLRYHQSRSLLPL